MNERRYGQWAGNRKGIKERPEDCVWEVWPSDGFMIPHQCSRRRGQGPDGLYCKQHAKKMKDN